MNDYDIVKVTVSVGFTCINVFSRMSMRFIDFTWNSRTSAKKGLGQECIDRGCDRAFVKRDSRCTISAKVALPRSVIVSIIELAIMKLTLKETRTKTTN